MMAQMKKEIDTNRKIKCISMIILLIQNRYSLGCWLNKRISENGIFGFQRRFSCEKKRSALGGQMLCVAQHQ